MLSLHPRPTHSLCTCVDCLAALLHVLVASNVKTWAAKELRFGPCSTRFSISKRWPAFDHFTWHIRQANTFLAASFHDWIGASQRVQNFFL
ncbi:hypothetical protein Fuma_02549 [Fuerstiella marisgermanici]|uniref:Uncharacterized protein n=1 Tax=Fuerstiella marisgermanici TaxID=1891926 RepID=A0A1P8WFX0_9PLAN|nr:hypothetical protein Fuma_02549 [Fuerstiella marisgermanici]